MEKYLAPAPIGEGDLTGGWLRFKREFQHFLIAIGKGDATEPVNLAIFLRITGPQVNNLYERWNLIARQTGANSVSFLVNWMG